MNLNLEHINKLIKEYHKILQTKRRVETISKELDFQKNRLIELSKIMKKEYNDLLSLEYLSLKQFFSTILKNKNEQIAKEKQEGKIRKKANIDKAQAKIYVIKKLLLFLKNELKDVEVFQKYFRRSKALIHGFNIEYYNDLITDWIKDSNLSETITTTLDANTTIIKLIKS